MGDDDHHGGSSGDAAAPAAPNGDHWRPALEDTRVGTSGASAFMQKETC